MCVRMLVLDTLGAFTQAQDWEEGQRPIVWASNSYLMEQTGFSLSALKRHSRRLAEIGVIAFKDSPNGKRWGHRDADGRIIEAYGFDLSPLSARAEEFEQLHVDGVVEMMLDATQAYDKPLDAERLFSWHVALFPTGRSGMTRIRVGQWRDGPMEVVSGPYGREHVHFEAPEAERLDPDMN